MVSANDPVKKSPRKKVNDGTRPGEKSVGDALRQVYSDAVQEDVPDDLLDLLRKLD